MNWYIILLSDTRLLAVTSTDKPKRINNWEYTLLLTNENEPHAFETKLKAIRYLNQNFKAEHINRNDLIPDAYFKESTL